jgi:hypothetical protein
MMSIQNDKAVAFRSLCAERTRFLEDRGFRRIPEWEHCSTTMCSVVYLGRHIGFVFSLDMRDDCVDLRLVQLSEGTLESAWASRREVDLYDYLVKTRGYRGAPAPIRLPSTQTPQTDQQAEALEGLINLLKTAGAELLNDVPSPFAVR